MITKHELKQYRAEVVALKQVKRRIDEIENLQYALKSPSLSGMPHAQQTESGSSQERAADKYSEELDELKKYYKAEAARLAAGSYAVEQCIERLPTRMRTIMRAHYIEGRRWQDVAEEHSYSWERVMQLHRRALDLIKKNGEEDSK